MASSVVGSQGLTQPEARSRMLRSQGRGDGQEAYGVVAFRRTEPLKGLPQVIIDPKVVRVSPLFQISTNDTDFVVLSPDNTNAAVIFDARLSSDVENDPLQYFWFEAGDTNAFGSTVMVTNVLQVGAHEIVLLVRDGVATGTQSLTVEVITSAQAVAGLLLLVDDNVTSGKNKRPLVATLNAAMASFDRYSFEAGINQLVAFQNKVLAQVAPSDPTIAGAFIEAATAILDRLIDVETDPRASR